ncbi:WD repeat-containing protein 89 homolog [Phtheirospermum japonicum]|uniref:WD repeat-containing protein 89 homolog n=1 Tax=Phtheirospermum japonicum TaxID=374723 RepID=A0A830BLU2_9LAMI|nr:WD repeat-containing protein 89 homolog [Phtheirospermum japonicum]
MEISEEMDIEEEKPSPNPNNLKRFGLKNSIQTNFGDDYVFQIIRKDDWTSMAVSLSTNAVKLYSPLTGQYLGECKGHTSTINEISFAGPSAPHLLYSCSSDCTLRAWDSRSFQQVACINSGPSQEVFSFSFGGPGDNLLAAGCKSLINFWDWRTMKQTACLEESHTEDVTQVQFVPGHPSKLVSASVDGLMCLFDASGDINDDDHLVSVFNVGTSIGKMGFFGEANQKLWCLTHIETLSVWDWNDARTDANFEDARTLASDSWALDHVDYFVDCHYSTEEDRLWVIGGTNAGTFGYFPVKYGSVNSIGSPEAVFHGGHTGIVRSVLPMSSIPGRNSKSHGIFGWTGGEDGRMCCWLSDDSTETTNCSWVSSALVEKSSKTKRKMRHSPYSRK